jgi:hypothetical protein
MLEDSSYRDKPGKRLGAPEFQQCTHAWYITARRIRKGWKVSLELAEFTLEELACIDLQVRGWVGQAEELLVAMGCLDVGT